MTDSITIDDDIHSVWSKFPTSIRNDPCFSAVREEFERANGKSYDYNTLIQSNFCFKPLLFPYTADAFTAQNELLSPQTIGETQASAGGSGQSNFTVMKHMIFALVWAFVAWHLLTVKEKNLPKFDIVANFNQTKSKHLTFK